MKVEFVDLKAQYEEIREEIDAAISGVIADTAFIGGKRVSAFEAAFAEYCGVSQCIGVANGTDAIYLALLTLGVGSGDEVITAANSFIATSEAITRTGAKVVFADCDPGTYNIDMDHVARLISPRTKAVVPVHLYGLPADMERLLELKREHGFSIVQDAAQAHGAELKGKKLPAFGDCVCYSFYPGKNLGAYGDAGAVVCDDADFASRLRMMANHGRKAKYDHEFEGVNSRLDGIQAAVLSVKLSHLDRWNSRRIEAAKYYTRELGGLVPAPVVPDGCKHVFHLYVIRVDNRQAVMDEMKERGVGTGIHYPIPLPYLKAYSYLGHTAADFPVSHGYKDKLLSLPVHGSIKDAEVEYTVECLKSALKKHGAA